jgi:hypothetical protein
LLLLVLNLLFTTAVFAQAPNLPGQPVGLDNTPQRDTSRRQQATDWDHTPPVIHAQKAYNGTRFTPDTSLSSLHRPQVDGLLYRDLGNFGSAAQWVQWRPTLAKPNPSFGYPAFDLYRFDTDSLLYYNTTRPYSEFQYRLGSQLEQWAEILHTQNIRPQWNFAARYRKITSTGAFRTQRTNHDNASLSTHYTSKGLHYELYGAVVFNNFQQDENGGIVSAADLTNDLYGDRATVPVRIGSAGYSNRRSPVYNTLRDGQVLLQHGYTFGRVDTTYNADSTRYDAALRSRFRILHRLSLGSYRHIYNDLRPDSLRYTALFQRSFSGSDSVYALQRQQWTDNNVQLQSFVGKGPAPLLVSAGVGIRTDRFVSEAPSVQSTESLFNSYLTGTVTNEASDSARLWRLNAQGIFYVAGPSIGNFDVSATVARMVGKDILLTAEARQQLGEAPYAFRYYQNAFYNRDQSFSKETYTRLGATLQIPSRRFTVGFHSLLIGNYLYTDSLNNTLQQSGVFQVLQATLSKRFGFGKWVSDHELVLQQRNGDGPLNLPLYSGRHSLAWQSALFKDAISIFSGLELRYNTPWYADGYSAVLGRFYHQSDVQLSNPPELTAFFNFRVKRFRASLSIDQIQQLLIRKNVQRYLYYPAPGFGFRFGFSWGLVN